MTKSATVFNRCTRDHLIEMFIIDNEHPVTHPNIIEFKKMY